MSTKKTSDLAPLVATKGQATPVVSMPTRSAQAPGVCAAPVLAKPPGEAGAPLNFRVSMTFKREFRQYALDHDLKLNELLRKAFETLKREEP